MSLFDPHDPTQNRQTHNNYKRNTSPPYNPADGHNLLGRGVGIMLFKDALSGDNLLKYRVQYETNAKYIEGVQELIEKGFHVKAIVCDGRRGLIQSFDDIPVQMCQFHQVAIIRLYLTLQAGRELADIVSMMKKTDKDSFVGALSDWHDRWEKFISERTINPETGKSFYTHKNLRSVYRSLKHNTPWLFTWYDHIELGIPNTTMPSMVILLI